jgi:hypothetical protein
VLSDGIVSGFVWDLIMEPCVGRSSSAEPLKPLFSKHFRWLQGSSPLVRWLTEWLEQRFQTISFITL